MKCQICGATSGREHLFREMMFGSGDEFLYWECVSCGCLQIRDIPARLADYYPATYYSFSLHSARWKRWYYRGHILFPRIMRRLHRCKPDFESIIAARPRPSSHILDVGCGNGNMVDILRNIGFDAWGIEPFLQGSRPHLWKKALEDVDCGWDLIMFHHVLEHMSNHAAVLRTARSKISAKGVCLVRIPLVNWAWEHYGRDWIQLDCPRHLVIHTRRSFELVAKSAGFKISKVIFDSTEFQFWGSELYRRNTSLIQGQRNGDDRLAPRDLKELQSRADRLNSEQKGDQAAFFLTPV
jgi:SAM-dependent methyltransferase